MTAHTTFQKRFINVQVIVPKGTRKQDYNTGQKTLIASSNSFSTLNYRIKASIVFFGGRTAAQLQLQIFNLPQTVMSQLSDLGNPGNILYDNKGDTIKVKVYAGSDPRALTMVFDGIMTQGHEDYTTVPDPFFFIMGTSTQVLQLKPVDAISYNGIVSCSQIVRQIADQFQMTVEDNGVTTSVEYPYLSGSARNQMDKLALMGSFNYIIENNTIAIWPKGGVRSKFILMGGMDLPDRYKASSRVISPSNGLLGYPSVNGVEVKFRTLFRPELRFGDQVGLDTSFSNARGNYQITSVVHQISSEDAGGEWFTDIEAIRWGSSRPGEQAAQ